MLGPGPLVKPHQHALLELTVAPLRVLAAQPSAHHPLCEVGKLERIL
jgi:hypothetical protein